MGSIVEVGLANAAVVAVLALVVGGLGSVCRRPALVHSLWVIVLIKLLTPPLLSVPLPHLSWGEEQVKTLEIVLVEPTDLDDLIDEANDMMTIEPALTPEPGWSWRSLLLAGWLTGSLGWLAVTLTRVGKFRRVLDEAQLAPRDLQERVEALADRIGLARGPEVRVVDGVISPMVWALFGRPRLILPTGLWDRLNDDQRTTLIVHELAHLRRRDHWVRHLELVTTALYWWHPALWWARRALRASEEECCDAWVVWAMPKANKTYASALLEALDFLCEAQDRSLPLGASGAGPVKSLKRRLVMILRGMTPRSLSLTGRLAVLGLAGLLLPILPSTTTAQAVADQKADDPAQSSDERVQIQVIDPARSKSTASPDLVTSYQRTDGAMPTSAQKQALRAYSARRIDVLAGQNEGGYTLTLDKPGEGEVEDKEANASPDKKAEIAKARVEVKSAQTRLQAAMKRLVELEGKNARSEIKMVIVNAQKAVEDQIRQVETLDRGMRVQVQGRGAVERGESPRLRTRGGEADSNRPSTPMALTPSVPSLPMLGGQLGDQGDSARPGTPIAPVPPATSLPMLGDRSRRVEVEVRDVQEKRLEAIEKRLELLLDEIKSMKSTTSVSPLKRAMKSPTRE